MTSTGRPISILGVPTTAGSHNPGQEKAPAAWRAAGLVDGLRKAGLDVEDRGDLPAAPFRARLPARTTRDQATRPWTSPWRALATAGRC